MSDAGLKPVVVYHNLSPAELYEKVGGWSGMRGWLRGGGSTAGLIACAVARQSHLRQPRSSMQLHVPAPLLSLRCRLFSSSPPVTSWLAALWPPCPAPRPAARWLRPLLQWGSAAVAALE